MRLVAILQLCLSAAYAFAGATTKPLIDLDSGDNKIVLLGNGFIEQSRSTGYIESRLLRHGLTHAMIIRNLGWSGDSVTGAARTGGFEEPAGMDRLLKETAAQKPTMIFVAYGMVESFEGQRGLESFTHGYETLLNALQKITPRLVLISPTFHEDLGRPHPDPAEHNRQLELYTRAISDLAQKRGLAFVDLFHAMMRSKRSDPRRELTTNGITLTPDGYQVVASQIEGQLELGGENEPVNEDLRQLVVKSNELFYRRWRPYNDHSRHWTYIGGDFALYEQQLAELDKRIEDLRHRLNEPSTRP